MSTTPREVPTSESRVWAVGRSGVVSRPDRHLLKEFCEQTDSRVVADGGIAHLDDLHELHELVPDGLDGIILNAPLYNGAFMYAEAVAAGANRFDMFFWGPPQP